jgi:iron complex transport system ATP-binding protein
VTGSGEFRADGVAYRYPDAVRHALADVDFAAPPGELTAVIGPNGSGKSTLLRLLLGTAAPDAGTVTFAGVAPRAWHRRALARRVGVVAQSETVAFPIRVGEYVAMGRYPHLGPWGRPGRADDDAIREALARCDVADLGDRDLATLSGGERQRVRIARALAQEPDALVLDEPTASLDVRHEMAIFRLLRTLAGEGRTVVLVTHSLNLSGRFADRLLLLDGGRAAAQGPPSRVLAEPVIARVYRWPVRVTAHPGPGEDAGAPQVVPLLMPRGDPQSEVSHPTPFDPGTP